MTTCIIPIIPIPVFPCQWFWSRDVRCMWVRIPLPGATAPSLLRTLHYRGFTITLRHTTLGRTPPDELSLRRGDLYLTTHNNHTRQSSAPPAGFEPAIPAIKRPHTHVLRPRGPRSAVRSLLPVITNWHCCCCS